MIQPGFRPAAVAGFVARWWGKWRDRFVAAGGRADEWRVRVELPSIVAKLDRAAAKRIIHPNRAARLKSRLSAHLKSAKKK